MHNPVPKRFRRPVGNLLLFPLFYLAFIGLHAIIDGRAPAPPSFAIIGFLIGSLVAVWIHAAMQDESD